MKSSKRKRPVVIVGPVPPPHNGMSVFTRMVLDHARAARGGTFVHLDTSDRRGYANLGRLDLTNVALAVRHALALAVLVFCRRPRTVYIPVSQNFWAFLRDALLIWTARAGGCRVVAHLHGSEFRERFFLAQPVWMRWFVRITCRQLHRAVVLGPRLRTCFEGLVPADRIKVVPNGIPVTSVAVPPSEELATGCLRVMFLSSLQPRKGILTLLAAARQVCTQRTDIEFRCYGEWRTERLKDEAKSLLGDLSNDPRIGFPGVIWGRAKERAYQLADVFVFVPEEPEGMPLVLLEAMAAGLPIICTLQGAVADMLTDKVDALFVPPSDPDAVCRAILHLADDARERSRLGEAARTRFLSDFTSQQCWARLHRVLCGAA